jgi:hypothetical protein
LLFTANVVTDPAPEFVTNANATVLAWVVVAVLPPPPQAISDAAISMIIVKNSARREVRDVREGTCDTMHRRDDVRDTPRKMLH